MSTRCQILFADPDSSTGFHDAIIYRHSDGYPDTEHGVLADITPILKRFKAARGFDPFYGTAHVLAELIRLAFENNKRLIKDRMKNAKKNGENFTASEKSVYEKFAFAGMGVEAWTGIFHGDVRYVYIVYPKYIEVRKTDFFGDKDSTLDNTEVMEKVKY
jgi:hypothetical protein